MSDVADTFELYNKLLNEGFKQTPRDTMLFISIDLLQQWRPDLTDEVLARFGFSRGVHLVMVTDGEIIPVTPEECP